MLSSPICILSIITVFIESKNTGGICRQNMHLSIENACNMVYYNNKQWCSYGLSSFRPTEAILTYERKVQRHEAKLSVSNCS